MKSNSVHMTISGVEETISNIDSVPKIVVRSVKKEMRIIGREMLVDLKDLTPVVTGRLRKSAYFEMLNDNDQFIQGAIGYTMPYAPEVEMRTGMLSSTLRDWEDEIRERLFDSMINSINKMKSTKADSGREADEPEEPAEE